ncbi:MAG: metallophosphoesterase [Desulfurococcaceae archaeon]
MIKNTREKLISATVVFIILVAGMLSLSAQQTTMSSYNPSYLDFAKPLPVTDFGPTAPMVVEPGGCFIGTLSNNYDINYAYIWTVQQDNLKLLNYTVTLEKLDSNKIRICIPRSSEEGVYDLVLISQTGQYSVPRSVWVVNNLPNSIRVVAMSDLHFGAGPDKVYNGDVNRFSAAILAASLNPTFIIWAGDITDHASENEAQFAQSYRYILLYKYPVLGVAGNHDYPSSNYEKYLGPTRWIRVIGDKLIVIGVYTVPYISENNIITWDEIKFMEEALRNYSYIPYKIIITHYPMFYYQGELYTRYDDEELLKPYSQGATTPVSSYWSVNMTAFRYVLKLIEDYNVTVVISGHIHVDQYVKYVSTRTNTTTYFITITTAAHGSATYQGLTVFDLDLTNGKITFPVTPPGFIGFNNSTSRSASNSIPVSIARTKLVRTPVYYKLAVGNTAPWYTINATNIIALPWISELKTIETKVDIQGKGAEIDILNTLLINNILFINLKLIVPSGSSGVLHIAWLNDEKPPIVELTGRKYYPSIPQLNRSFTVYVKISDDAWGLDFDNIVVKFNGTSITLNYSPETLTSNMNEVYLTLTLVTRGDSKVTTVLEIYAVDNYGRNTTKKYGIVFYPPGETPAEEPVYEIEEATVSTTQTQISTITSITETTTTQTPTVTQVSSESTLQTSTATTTSASSQIIQTTVTTPSETPSTSTGYYSTTTRITTTITTSQFTEGSSVMWIIVAGVVLTMIIILYFTIRRK